MIGLPGLSLWHGHQWQMSQMMGAEWNTAYFFLISKLALTASHKGVADLLEHKARTSFGTYSLSRSLAAVYFLGREIVRRISLDFTYPLLFTHLTPLQWCMLTLPDTQSFYISMIDQHYLVYHLYYITGRLSFLLGGYMILNLSRLPTFNPWTEASELHCQDDQTNQCRRSRVVHPGNSGW